MKLQNLVNPELLAFTTEGKARFVQGYFTSTNKKLTDALLKIENIEKAPDQSGAKNQQD